MGRFLLILLLSSLALFYCVNRVFTEPSEKEPLPKDASYITLKSSEYLDTLSLGFHYKNIVSHFKKPAFQETKTTFIYRDDKKIEDYYNSYLSSDDKFFQDIGYFGVSVCNLEQDLYEPSINNLVKISDQTNPYYLLTKGRIYLKGGMYTEAAEMLNTALKGGADKDLVLPHLSRLYYYSKQYNALAGLLEDSSNKKYFSAYMLSDVNFLHGNIQEYWQSRFIPPSIDINFLAGFLILLVWFIFLVQLNVFKKNNWAGYLLIFFLGTSFSYLCFPLYDFYDLVLGFSRNGNVGNDLLYCILGIGVIEELVKIIPFLLVLRFTGFIKEPIDYLIYASISALGFAFAENLGYLSREGIDVIRGRALTATVSHMFDSSLIAYGLVLAKYRYIKSQILYFFIFFGLAAFTHGFYDFWIINETVRIFSMITLLFMLVCLLFWITFLNNALNNSPFFTYNKNVNSDFLRKYLTSSVLGIIMVQYALSAWEQGAERANMELSVSLVSTAFFTFFYASNFSYFDLIKSHWEPVSLHRFAWKTWYNKLIGRRIYITAAREGNYSSVFPLSAVITGRKAIGKEVDFYTIKPDKPVEIKERIVEEFFLQIADKTVLEEDEDTLVLVLLSDEAIQGEKLKKKDLKLVAKAFVILEKEERL